MTEDMRITPIVVMIAISVMAIGFVMGLRNKKANLKFRLTGKEKDKIGVKDDKDIEY